MFNYLCKWNRFLKTCLQSTIKTIKLATTIILELKDNKWFFQFLVMIKASIDYDIKIKTGLSQQNRLEPLQTSIYAKLFQAWKSDLDTSVSTRTN